MEVYLKERNRSVFKRTKQNCIKKNEIEVYLEERNRSVFKRTKQKCI